MDREVVEISDSDESEEKNNTKKTPTIRAAKIEVENEKLSYKSKLDELRNKVSNIKKRNKTSEHQDSDEEGSPAKKPKTSVIDATTGNSTEESEKDSVLNGKGKDVPKVALPSFQSLSTASFETVVKVSKPSVLDSKYTETEAPVPTSNEEIEVDGEAVVIGPQEAPETPRTRNEVPLCKRNSKDRNGSELQSRNVASSDRVDNEMLKPILKVTFRDRDTARLFRKSVYDALVEVLAVAEPEVDESKGSVSLELKIWESDIPDTADPIEGIQDLFKVDTAPTKTPLQRQLPKYRQLITNALSDKRPDNETVEKPGAGSAVPNTCFNCDGNHLLSDCTKPINDAIVSRNRQKHMQNRKSQPRTSRYHVDEEQRFAHLVPGKISDELRAAMGLKKNQLPRFIYRMRMFGYPPGWLEETRITHSGIALINESSNAEGSGDLANDGKDTYDISKLIDYPGYNVPSTHDLLDESRKHQCPGMQWKHSKEAMIQNIGSSAAKGYRKKKAGTNATVVPGDLQTNDDMEVVEIDDEVMIVLDSTADPEYLEDSSQNTNADDQSQAESGACSQDSSRAQSPDLACLEAQKQKLLIELESSGSSSLSATPSRTPATPVTSTPETTLGRSKSLAMGTPIIKSASPFGNLPSAEMFSKGISDHLNFENLPDATGKYEKMKTIINKVRQVVEQVQEGDDSSS